MSEAAEPQLSLAEWLALCLICEQPTHGFAIAGLLGRDGDLGRIWRVPKFVIYRAIGRLGVLGLVRAAGVQHTGIGPARSLWEVTLAGRRLGRAWLSTPAGHARDVRSELLLKLALMERAGIDPRELLEAQHALLVPIAAAIGDHLQQAEGFDRTIALWRHETICAALRFLDTESRA
jgi:PadR family transcriptional regulator AphA